MRGTYLDSNKQAANLLDAKYDVFVVHDPQPAAIRHYAGARDAKWIWRCHIDSSSPNPQVSSFILPLIREYDALVFTMREFALPGLEDKPLTIIPPAIDPLATKNTEIPLDLCKRVIARGGREPESADAAPGVAVRSVERPDGRNRGLPDREGRKCLVCSLF